MNKKQKKMLTRILLASAIFAVSVLLRKFEYISFFLLLGAYVISGYDILAKAVRGTLRKDLFDENFLMALATVSAVITGEYHEAVFVMVFYQTGELFQSVAVGKSRKSIAKLMEICPDSAWLEKEGEILSVHPSEVKRGDIILIKPSEKIPLDGIIESGSTEVNTSPLTGESLPRFLQKGESVVSGCINLSGAVRVRVTKEFSESTVSKILELTENASAVKARTESFITRFARVYTPTVVIIAAIIALVPPLFTGIADFGVWKEWIHRAMTLLVISCPCALVISVPLSFFGGIGALSRRGVLVKGGSFIETLAKCDTVIFDKTGTLTEGSFEVSDVILQNSDSDDILTAAASAEYYSAHPLAAALRNSCQNVQRPDSVKELAGLGVVAKCGEDTIAVGNIKLMEKLGIPANDVDKTSVFVVRNNDLLGCVIFEDKIKPSAIQAMRELKNCGVTDVVMLTGDKKKSAETVALRLGIERVYSELLPQDKLSITEDIIKEKTGGKVAFVGDGINDAPTLARADIGIAMGKLGTEAASEAADIVLMDDDPAKIAATAVLCRKTVEIVRQNILLVLSVKFAAIILGAMGVAGMWIAVFADVGVAVLAILNSMRIK